MYIVNNNVDTQIATQSEESKNGESRFFTYFFGEIMGDNKQAVAMLLRLMMIT